VCREDACRGGCKVDRAVCLRVHLLGERCVPFRLDLYHSPCLHLGSPHAKRSVEEMQWAGSHDRRAERRHAFETITNVASKARKYSSTTIQRDIEISHCRSYRISHYCLRSINPSELIASHVEEYPSYRRPRQSQPNPHSPPTRQIMERHQHDPHI